MQGPIRYTGVNPTPPKCGDLHLSGVRLGVKDTKKMCSKETEFFLLTIICSIES